MNSIFRILNQLNIFLVIGGALLEKNNVVIFVDVKKIMLHQFQPHSIEEDDQKDETRSHLPFLVLKQLNF